MKWKNPKNGDRKIITHFLFLPVEIDYETRWLERATMEIEYRDCGREGGYWKYIRWVNE